jgi:hypothetical protein
MPNKVLNWPINVAMCTILGSKVGNFFSRSINSSGAFKFPLRFQTPFQGTLLNRRRAEKAGQWPQLRAYFLETRKNAVNIYQGKKAGSVNLSKEEV